MVFKIEKHILMVAMSDVQSYMYPLYMGETLQGKALGGLHVKVIVEVCIQLLLKH